MSLRKYVGQLWLKVCKKVDVELKFYAPKQKMNSEEFLKQLKGRLKVLAIIGCLLYLGSTLKLLTMDLMQRKRNILDVQQYKKLQKYNKEQMEKLSELHWREMRFYQFASVEYNGQIFMTPKDFLESTVKSHPTPRMKRLVLTKADLETYKQSTPRKQSKELFRSLRDQGIISFTEYLFLLATLTKPRYSFEIAFQMFDTDGNKTVDINEFLEIERIISQSYSQKKKMGETRRRILSTMITQTEEMEENSEEKKLKLRPYSGPPTTLLVHFFGTNYSSKITSKQFCQFIDNLQTELCIVEFNDFGKGNKYISELDFATILLRYTKLSPESHSVYLARLIYRLDREVGISLQDFCSFMRFLNHLDDFLVAIRMWTHTNQAVDRDTLRHIIRVCTGSLLANHVINTVFAIFDVDGDGYLSYEEFIAIMRDRAKRGIRDADSYVGWIGYKKCVRQNFNLN